MVSPMGAIFTATLFLALIYATFISLGLPDSLLGAAWPVMQPDLGVPYSFAGVISMLIAGSTIIASFSSGSLLPRFGSGAVTRVSVALTAVALFGFSQAPSYGWLLALAVPLGLGGGAVDAALNHFVATHYAAHHMNWLHCFWGVGAMTGPLILSRFIAQGGDWRGGYLIISLIQIGLAAILFASIPLWRRMEGERPAAGAPVREAARQPGGDEGQTAESALQARSYTLGRLLRLPGVAPGLLAFFLYCGLEATMGLWGSSFLVRARGFDPVAAAFGVSLFYGSLTFGRFVSGFASMRMSNPGLIRAGLWTILAGMAVMFIPVGGVVPLVGFALVGLGCAPIYPAMLHETPRRFGEAAVSLIGIQMGVAYTGTTFLPPAFGWITAGRHLGWLPVVVLLYASLMLLATEVVERRTAWAAAEGPGSP